MYLTLFGKHPLSHFSVFGFYSSHFFSLKIIIILFLQVCHKEKQETLCTSCNKEQLGQKVDQ